MEKYITAIFSLLMLLTISCNNRSATKAQDDEYEIISLLYDSLAQKIPTPPVFFDEVLLPSDSIEAVENSRRIRDSILSIPHIVAVDSKMSPIEFVLINLSFSDQQKELINRLKSLEDYHDLKISNIQTTRNDSLVELEEISGDNMRFHQFLSFSRIAFSRSKDEAVVIASSGTSKLDTLTAIYFFEKKGNQWVLIDSKRLTMS